MRERLLRLPWAKEETAEKKEEEKENNQPHHDNNPKVVRYRQTSQIAARRCESFQIFP
jgi:hypothetical protein